MTKHGERGFALPAVIGALVIILLLITAGFFVAGQELRMGVANRHANMAFNIAQAGANEVLANWNGYQLGNIAVWDETVISENFGTIGEWEVTIHNTNNFVYFLTSTGAVTNAGLWSGARRTIGIVTKMIFADIDPPGALTTTGDVKVFGNASINGNDDPPADWDGAGLCAGVDDTDMPGIVHDGGTMGGTEGQHLIGDPPTEFDATVAPATFTDFGNLTWAELVALAQAEGKDVTSVSNNLNSIGPALDGGGDCDEAPLTNWGDIDSADPCGSYFPLIYHGSGQMVAGERYVTLSGGGQGQGVLLIEHNLVLNGGFTFYGIIITMGTFETTGNDNTVYGAVLAANGIVVDQDQGVGGNSSIQYSRCAVQRSILNNASLSKARPLAERSWVDLTAAVN